MLISGFVQGLGMGLVFMPLNSLAFATLESRFRPTGPACSTCSVRSGSRPAFRWSPCSARNIQVSHADLSQHITDKLVPGVNLSQLDQLGLGRTRSSAWSTAWSTGRPR